jgi:integrase/recombinase XerD
VAVEKAVLTAKQFGALSAVPPELEWLANITNAHTRRAYKNDVDEFVAFSGLRSFAELRGISRAHVIAWRKDLESRKLSPATIRRKLSALSALFDYLCESNAVAGNPVDGVKRPMANGNEGLTPALGDAQARKLIDTPPADTLKGVRDRATLLYHGIRREELCGLRVRDMQSRQGVMHFRVKGKRDKIRFVPMHPMAQRLIEEVSGDGRSRGRCRRPCVPSRVQQSHGRARQAARWAFGLRQRRAELCEGNRRQRKN